MKLCGLFHGALATAVLLLAGCAEGSVADPTGGSTLTSGGGGGAAPVMNSGRPASLDLADGALDSVPFQGVRRVWQRHGNSRNDILELREEVASDGLGRYVIDLLDKIQLPAGMDGSMYELSHARSRDVYWRHRDFRIQGVDLAEQNYRISVIPGSFQVAGRATERIELIRHVPVGGRPGHYVVDIDPTNGFVLASKELDGNGNSLQEMIYESIDFDPSFDGVMLRDGALGRTPIDLNGALDGVVEFDVLMPDLMPPGFEIAGAVVLTVPDSFTDNADSFLRGGDWVRFSATDGIESVTFAHADSSRLTAGYIESTMRVVSEGSWEYGFGQIGRVSFVVAGRVDSDDLRRLVESAF